MPSIVFVAPIHASATLRFVQAAASIPGVRCGLVSQEPGESLPADLRQKLAAHWRVEDAFNSDQLAAAVQALSRTIGPVSRLLGILEQLQVPLAEARRKLGIPGLTPEVANNFRDKALMKTILRQHGLPCAKHALAHSADEALSFASQVGFPLVIKPQAGAGAKATFRVDDLPALRQALQVHQPTAAHPTLVEEFVVGDEFAFDSIAVDGRVRWHSFTRYLPTPLEVLRNPWIQWCVVLPRSIDEPRYRAFREIGAKALSVLGLDTAMAHMEWFQRRDGSFAISEVAARPPGAQFTTLLSYAHDADFYSLWARLMATGELHAPERRHAVGAAYLRGQGTGRIVAVHGLDEAQREMGGLVVEARLPQKGQAPADTYEGDGYVIFRHDDTAVVERALARTISLVRVELA